MAITLGFDVYGTLIDTTGVTSALQVFIGEMAPQFAAVWREKQVEYSFRRGLMQNYCKFSECTRHALDYTCVLLDVKIDLSAKESLMGEYRKLPAFADAKEALPRLRSAGYRLYAFSNGHAADVNELLRNAGLDSYFLDIISTDEIRSFKPNPAVYAHFLRRAGTSGNGSWLISGNPFDVIGALSAGMRGAWVKRLDSAIFDPWEFEPTATVRSLVELEQVLP